MPADATADPYRPALTRVAARPLGSVTTSAGAAAATLEPKDFAVPVDSRYSFAAKVRVDGKADLVQMRFKVLNPSGKLMIQRTIIQSDVTTGQASAVFERELADLGLEAGAYPVQLEVRVAQGNQVSEAVLDSELLLFDRKGQRIPLVFAVRVSGQPLADPSGRFVADPARYTRARDDAQALAQWVLDDDDARITLAISPLLLEEWRRISEGYVLTGPEGDVSVAATEAVPAAYDAALDTIQRAANTGRLELTHLGFADPNLADLSQQTLTRDIRPQYAYGRSALFAAIGATPSTGTVVAGGCIPPETIGALAGEGVAYGIVDASCTRSGQATATPGAYRVKNADLVVLVANAPAGRALAGGKTDAIARIAFERRLAGLSSPVVIRADVGPGALSVTELRAAVDSLLAQGWMRTALGREVAGRRMRRTVTLRTGRGATRAPVDYWDDVRAGRDWARALTAGFGADKPAAVTAQRDSLIAQCSAWAGPAGDWALADRGRAFANNATRLGKAVLGGVSLTVKPVTLAGTSGKVPVIISNEAKTPLTLRVTAIPSREVELEGKRSSVDGGHAQGQLHRGSGGSARLAVGPPHRGRVRRRAGARERFGDGARLVSRPTGDDSWRRAGAWSIARVYHQTCARRRDCGHEYVRRRKPEHAGPRW